MLDIKYIRKMHTLVQNRSSEERKRT